MIRRTPVAPAAPQQPSSIFKETPFEAIERAARTFEGEGRHTACIRLREAAQKLQIDQRAVAWHWHGDPNQIITDAEKTRRLAAGDTVAKGYSEALSYRVLGAGEPEAVYAVPTGDADAAGNELYTLTDEPVPFADNWTLYAGPRPKAPEPLNAAEDRRNA